MRIFQTGYGVGDILMASGVLRAWKHINNRQQVLVCSRFPELFRHNPDVLAVTSEQKYQKFLKLFAKPLIWRIGNVLDSMVLRPTYPFPAPGRH
jgi:hypothetical protein